MRAPYLLLLLLLAACTSQGKLSILQEKKPTRDNFSQALAAEYLAYAESLSEKGHPIRASYFASKGLSALNGDEVPLEEKPEYQESREALIAVLTPDIKDIDPAKAARAQQLYDCMAEGKQKLCKESFAEALSDLQSIAEIVVHGEDNRFNVPFAAGSAVLTPEANAALDVLAKRISGYGEYTLNMDVGTAKLGNAAKKTITDKRIFAIEQGLINRGARGMHVTTSNSTGREVKLSTDKESSDPDSIEVSIGTYVKPSAKGQAKP